MNVDLTDTKYPYLGTENLRHALEKAGENGSITISSETCLYLIGDIEKRAREREAEARLAALSGDLLKGVVLQGAARAAIPIPEDVRALVRLARELDSELKTPTPWPVEKPAPEEEDD